MIEQGLITAVWSHIDCVTESYFKPSVYKLFYFGSDDRYCNVIRNECEEGNNPMNLVQHLFI